MSASQSEKQEILGSSFSTDEKAEIPLQKLGFFQRQHASARLGQQVIVHAEQQHEERVVSAQEQQTQGSRASLQQRHRSTVDVKQQARLRKVFKQFASMEDPGTGEPVMTPDDFIKSVAKVHVQQGEQQDRKELSASESASQSQTLRMLFSMADTQETGRINFNEYVLLFKLLTTPEAELELLFRTFDVNKDGTISKQDFQKAMLLNKGHVNVNFDFDCDLMTRFFGRNGKAELSYTQFTQFLKLLQEEIRRQEFHDMDKEQSGYITPQQFAAWLTAYCARDQVPAKLRSNISNLANSFPTGSRVTFAEFDAFTRIMGNINGVAKSLSSASTEAGGDGSVTRDAFIRAAQQATGITPSPLEVSIIFRMFGADSEDKLKRDSFNEFVDLVQNDAERRKSVLDLWLKDRIEPQSLQELTPLQRIMRGLANFAMKTAYGGIAGAIGAAVVFPIDTVKTRMQNQRFNKDGSGQKLYKNSFDCFAKIYRNEGIRSFYRGLLPQMVGVAPEKAVKLVVNDYLRGLFGNPDNPNEIYFPLEVLAGAAAGASQVIVTNPLEITKIRLQMQGEVGQQKGAVQILRELGMSGLYKGASACFLRDIPFSAIYFPLYAKLKENFKAEGQKDTSPGMLLLAGTIAGSVAAGSVTPADVIKTRLQVEARKGEDTYNGLYDCFKKIYKNEGPAALFKGAAMRMCRSGPQFGVTLMCYELMGSFWKPPTSNSASGTQTLAANAPVGDEDVEALRAVYQLKLQQFGRIFGRSFGKPAQ